MSSHDLAQHIDAVRDFANPEAALADLIQSWHEGRRASRGLVQVQRNPSTAIGRWLNAELATDYKAWLETESLA
ncbi:MAG: hypothetical protein M3083_00370 [Actinomycetota bacterium]|nr:hypothetical protein [Actinomycetota bacterium]MDQ6948210.1 hypothetical protein [Actinomycetota bacterium]